MSITVLVKQVYGKTLYYPASDQACIFADLTGKKTFSDKDLRLIESLGFSIEKKMFE